MSSHLYSRAAVALALLAAPLLLATAGTAATTSPAPPTIESSNFVCSNGVCAIGPGNVGMPFAAGLIGTGGPEYGGPECNPYTMAVVAGSLPPGLQLGEPICEWEITGTPTKAGTYSFTVRITPQPDGLGNPSGPSGTQSFTITIGTGSADRVILTTAVWFRFSTTKRLQVAGFDVNQGATYTIYVTATGQELGTIGENAPDNGGDGTFTHNFSAKTDLDNLTVVDSLGGTATIPVTVNNKYS